MVVNSPGAWCIAALQFAGLLRVERRDPNSLGMERKFW
jgi:hypothetical protein